MDEEVYEKRLCARRAPDDPSIAGFSYTVDHRGRGDRHSIPVMLILIRVHVGFLLVSHDPVELDGRRPASLDRIIVTHGADGMTLMVTVSGVRDRRG
jgi:hypothetical protein